MLRQPRLFPLLRQQRTWLSLVLLAAFAVGTAAAFTWCARSSMPTSAMDTAAHDHAGSMSSCPGKLCTSMETDARDDIASAALLSGGLPLSPAVVLFVVLALLAVPRCVPVPPPPLLPKRSRTLKFYALRI